MLVPTPIEQVVELLHMYVTADVRQLWIRGSDADSVRLVKGLPCLSMTTRNIGPSGRSQYDRRYEGVVIYRDLYERKARPGVPCCWRAKVSRLSSRWPAGVGPLATILQ